MKRKTILVTGSSGLIGSEAVAYFDLQGHRTAGVDNNMRRESFGPAGDTLWNLGRLKNKAKSFRQVNVDIRDHAGIEELFWGKKSDLIVHCAAQPSHDKAREIPLVGFEVNELGTVDLLEATRQHALEAVFPLAFVPTGDHADPSRCYYALGCFILKTSVQQSSRVTQSV